ncbi:MAG TPA: type IV pilus biogenesis/stability protein PilW [Gammaproteobacteria bacterium]|nr:type IV pilus biogenesis/stability protein PilW [Gammaproteobacteria bacterium]
MRQTRYGAHNHTTLLGRILLLCLMAMVLWGCATTKELEQEEKTRFRIADTNLRLGLGYLQQGREEAALEKLKKAVDVMPDYAEAHSSIALAYERLGQRDKAGEHYRRAVELKPKDGAIQNNFAVFLCGQGEYQAAEEHFLKAINSRKYRTPAQAMENLGRCMMRAGDLKKAETYLRKALQINPRLPGALLLMAQISLEKKRLLSGRAYLQRYQEVARLGPDGLWLGMQVEKGLGDMAAVREYENQLRRNYPDSNEMRMLLEEEARQRGDAAAK